MGWFSLSWHALRRLIQRNQAKSVSDVRRILKAASGWMSVAVLTLHRGSFMVPVADGFVCCGMDVSVKDGTNGGEKFKLGLIRTFIGLDDMKPETYKVWSKLVALGVLENGPRCLALHNELVSPDLSAAPPYIRQVFRIMADEGKKWDARFEHWRATR